MNIIKTLKDDYGNIATIEKIGTITYRGATKKTSLFRLSLMAEFDNNFLFLYHVSCYETLEETLAELSKCSAGTFKEIERKRGNDMRLTEQYYMLTPCGLTPVRGKKYTEEYAVTYNHEKKSYNLTHIKSGTCISKDGFKRMKDCISTADDLIEIAEKFIAENPERIQKHIDTFNYCIERNLIN